MSARVGFQWLGQALPVPAVPPVTLPIPEVVIPAPAPAPAPAKKTNYAPLLVVGAVAVAIAAFAIGSSR
jgi:hypothetical protein